MTPRNMVLSTSRPQLSCEGLFRGPRRPGHVRRRIDAMPRERHPQHHSPPPAPVRDAQAGSSSSVALLRCEAERRRELASCQGGPPTMKVTIKEWNSVATWRWDIPEDDVCGICQVHFDGTCPTCRYPGDDCTLRESRPRPLVCLVPVCPPVEAPSWAPGASVMRLT